jgi:hypothetical protein
MSEDNEPQFAFEKKLGVHDMAYGNIKLIAESLQKLMLCMKETNKIHNVDCEFFRLDFRQPYFDERMQFPIGSLILDMKWGSKKELQEKSKKEE